MDTTFLSLRCITLRYSFRHFFPSPHVPISSTFYICISSLLSSYIHTFTFSLKQHPSPLASTSSRLQSSKLLFYPTETP
ncbi:hypothetical protein BO82DRAFT_36081 [Aspergillus uvarum CBS 121591]|uniref:Uncharacterized protein n=1 Tax=Aspergillus uvarum CBS 121591 TaxID=1448315 RepID=A0A319CHG1_9EURO|nr:hypothetical protein BO82DRAFT_36081 [Aspergillus uvarum CBS 121591]PYH83890.1 hypothetical protein BO82DRAFT_36081 [Aspergillus uvarum CBS 121591]